MLSLNQIINIIKTQAESHAQINTFYFGDPWEFGASSPITYPFCGAVLDSSTYTDNILTTNIRLFVCDLVHKDENNETEVLSDSRQVLLDIFSLIDDYLYDQSGVILSDNITINHFTERFDDEVAGVEATISLTQFYNKDTCQIPTITNTNEPPFIQATGGTITTDGNYKIHTFTGSGTFQVTANPNNYNIEVLVVGGGGSGGGFAYGGGGGGGQVVYNSSYPVAVQSYAVVVGAGGAGSSSNPPAKNNGEFSSFDTIIAAGGGAGGGFQQSGNNSVNAGGAGYPGGAGVGVYSGGDSAVTGLQGLGGGGAGAGANGADANPATASAGDGGNGVAYSISGSSIYYGGGGGGGTLQSVGFTQGTGGLGGGGNAGQNGTDGLGGGGGGAIWDNVGTSGGDGGNGVVIIKYQYQ